jgi:hypothetical protein
MLEVEVNPADVVSIPADYNQAKMRVCKYQVIGLVDKEHSSDERLRVSTPPAAPASPCCNHDDCEAEDEDDDGFHECESCGGECEEGYDYCSDCEDAGYDEEEEEEDEEEEEEDEEEEECVECGALIYDSESDLCDDCEEELEEEEDEYPWEDEID